LSLVTYEDVDAELAATASYAADGDVSLAKRRVTALLRKLDFAQQSANSGQMVAFQMQVIQTQLDQCRAFLRMNDTPSDNAKLTNPSVVHYDQSTLRGRTINPFLYDGGVP